MRSVIGPRRTSNSIATSIIAGLLTWLVSSFALAFLVGGLNLPKYWTLAERGINTEGVVIAKEPANHRLVRYTYSIDQSSYFGSDQVGDFERLKIGDPVTVSYDPLNPSMSLLGDPRQRLTNELVSVGAVAILFPTIIVGLLYSRGVLPVYRRS